MLKFLLILAILGLVVWVAKVIFSPPSQSVSTELPDELKNARIWAKEKPFSTKAPIRLNGRIDEAFELPDGQIVVSDTKSRKALRVYDSDVLQVSSYRVAIQSSTGKVVADHGYVRLLTPDGNAYKRISLLDSDEVAAAYQMFNDLRSGKYTGSKCGRAAVCRTCAYKPECDSMPA